MKQQQGFFAASFDIPLVNVATLRRVKVIYVLVMIFTGLLVRGGVISTDRVTATFAVASLVVFAPLYFVGTASLWRKVLEVLTVVINREASRLRRLRGTYWGSVPLSGMRESRMHRLLVGASVLMAAVLLAACGGGSSGNGVAAKSPSQIASTALSAMKAAKSVHLQGSVTQSGKTVSIDASTFSDGDIDGSFVESGSTIELIKLGPTDYLKTTAAFYEANGAPSAVAALVGGRWIEAPDSSLGFGSKFGLAAFSNSLSSNEGSVTAGTTSTVDGQGVVSVHSSTGGTLYVATDGTPYPVEIVGSGGASGTGTITFSQWNQAAAPIAPKGARTIASFG